MKQYSLGSDARNTFRNVAAQVSNIVGKTIGPSGRNYFIPEGITNDGKTILQNIRFANECEDNAVLAFTEIAERADKDAGDGTSSAILIGTRLALDVLDIVPDLDVPTVNAVPVMQITRQLEDEKNKAIELLSKKVEKTDTLEKLTYVAETALEDKEAAQIVAKAIWEGGKDTLPVIEDGHKGILEKDTINGVRYDFSSASEDTFNKLNCAEYENVGVLVVNHVFEQYQELSPFMGSLVQAKPNISALFIIANNFSIPFIGRVAETNARSKFKILLAHKKNVDNEIYEDIAAYVNAKFVDTHPKKGVKITNVRHQDGGIAKKVILRKNEFLLIGGQGEEAVVEGDVMFTTRLGKRIEELESLKQDQNIERRLAILKGGITTLYVDAKTAVEKYYLKLKVEDAMNSCRSALRGGMVRGGGVALKEVAEEMSDTYLSGALSLLPNALREPYNRIQQNHGIELVVGDGVFDSFITVKSSIENAVSVVKILITTEGIIADAKLSMVEELKKVFE